MEQQSKGPMKEEDQQPKSAQQCQECKAETSKYTCPGCSLRSCSLPCVKSHKQRTGCSGKRNQTQYVPLPQFDDNLLLSDYNLLEEVKRVADSAQRSRLKVRGYPSFRLPYHLKSLQSAAASRRTKLLILPSGMSKREKNQSCYYKRKRCISWTIEWRFHSTDVVLMDHGVPEGETLASVIEKQLKPSPWNHKLRQFCDVPLDSLRFFILKLPNGAKSPFRELDKNSPLSRQLANVVILEYPVIHVFLPSHSCNFEIVKDDNPPTSNQVFNNEAQFQKGILFKEEEIEAEDDDNYLDSTRIPGFMNNSYSTLDNPLISEIEGAGSLEDMDFELDQVLIDAYSDLMADINPDDFISLDGEFDNEAQVAERKDVLNGRSEEELEEGEIAE